MPRISPTERRKIIELASQVLGGSRPVSRSEQLRIINQALGGSGSRARYARGTSRGGTLLQSIRRALGGVVSGTASEGDLVNAARVLREAGFGVTPGGTVVPPPVQRIPRGRPVPSPGRQPKPPPITSPNRRHEPRGPGQAGEPPLPGEASPFGEEVLTSQSSNVFSFSYARDSGARTGTLYVTFKAPKLNKDAVSTGRGRRGGRQQLRGRRGATITGKSNSRGPMYAYFDVPPGVFTRMRNASSKGKFVWDNLRIRGTIYGHQYRYQLVQGAVTTQGGVSGVYVPRKATKKGFRVRSVADVAQAGRRGYQSSTLPGQVGFSTRRRQ